MELGENGVGEDDMELTGGTDDLVWRMGCEMVVFMRGSTDNPPTNPEKRLAMRLQRSVGASSTY